MPDPGEDADAPIIVPRPGQILRRTARTKIRKQGQTGEGAHRFNATRRGAGSKRSTPPPPAVPDPRSSSDLSSDHDHSDAESPRHRRLFSNESLDGASRSDRPESYSAIFDAYARDDINDDSIRVISPPPLQPLPRRSLSPPPPATSREVPEPVPPIQVVPPAQPTPVLPPLQHPLPQRASSLGAPASGDTPSRSPSPVTTIHSELSSARPEPRPVQTPSTSSSAALQAPQGSDSRREKEKEKEKDKKGLFKWGGGEKKGKKDQREKEKDPGFFGSLFSSKKKPEEAAPVGLAHGQSGREAAVALLGASKSSRGYVPPASPQLQGGVNNYSRYPIHVERAIYRLSHIKLANPRRALYEQVLISNLMFWYLGVINKTQQPQSQQQQQQQGQTPTELGEARAHGQAPAVTDVSGLQKETEEKERAEIEQAESERGEARFTTQGQTQASPQGRRGSLTKAAPTNAGPRRAEQPVRGPQYDMQHRAMEQEYGAAFVGGARSTTGPPGIGYAAPPPGAMQIQVSMSMSGSVPSAAAVGALPSHQLALAAAGPHRSRSPPPPSGSGVRYVPPPPSIPPQPSIPQPQAQAIPTSASNPASPNPSPSAAQQVSLTSMEAAPARAPARSLSANATPQLMGPRLQGQGRKAQSARAVAPSAARRPRIMSDNPVQGNGEEEDVPLAVWQQQQSLLSQQPRRR
jgi:hypothetical protein